jgi:DHA3 family macrolide efflux protein-like MFS transporter
MATERAQPAPRPSESAMPPEGPDRGMRTFLLLWFSQFVSGVGTGLGSFALSVWVYRQNASTTQFAMTLFVGTCTALLVGPLAGVLADRWDRRKLILLSDAGAAMMTGLMALALYTGEMRLWHVYIILFFMVGFSVLQGPAFMATVSQLVPRRQLSRASGMAQTAGIATGLVCPPLAGALIPVIDYHGVILIDITTFLISFGILLFIRLPRPEAGGARRERRSMLADFGFGWTFIRERPGLLSLLGLFAVINFSLAIVQVLLTPLILSFGSAADLGFVRSAAAAGGLIGGLTLSLWGGPRNRVAGILLFVFLKAPLLLLGALQPSVLLISVATFFYMGLTPFTSGLSQAIWQSKVSHDIQGRVFAIRGLIATAAAPLAYLLAGPLADRVFKPLLLPGGPLADTVVGRWIGVGPGRGVGLMFIGLGLLILVAAILAALNPRLRQIEAEIPDAPHPSQTHATTPPQAEASLGGA